MLDFFLSRTPLTFLKEGGHSLLIDCVDAGCENILCLPVLCSSETKVSRTQIGYHFVNGGVYVPMIYDHMTPISVQEEFTSFKLPSTQRLFCSPHPGPFPLLYNWGVLLGVKLGCGGGKWEILGMCLYFPGIWPQGSRWDLRSFSAADLLLRACVEYILSIIIEIKHRAIPVFTGSGQYSLGGGGERGKALLFFINRARSGI